MLTANYRFAVVAVYGNRSRGVGAKEAGRGGEGGGAARGESKETHC